MNEKDKKLENEQKIVFSQKLNYYMNLNHKQQDDIVTDLGINKSTISTWCRGIKMPRVNAIKQLADYFGIEISDLLEDKPSESSIRDSEKDLKVALFGGDGEVTDEMWDEVKKFAQYIKSTHDDKED